MDYCQFSDWGHRKSTRVWGTVQDLGTVLCDVKTCKNIQPGTQRHREVVGGSMKRMTAKDEYRVPAKLVEYLLTGEQPMITKSGEEIISPKESIRVDDVVEAAVGFADDANQCYKKVRAEFQNGEHRLLRVLVDTGAQANLIRTGVVPSAMFRPARQPMTFLTVSGETLAGGHREVAVRMSFHGTSQ